MTPRSIRRSAARKARKEMERKAANLALHAENARASQSDGAPLSTPLPRNSKSEESIPAGSISSRISVARQLANQANAQLSTGPKTFDGKSTSSLNAVKTALTGRTVLLPSDDVAAYERHIQAWQDDLRPVGARECDLLQSIADTTWRLRRVPCLENAIFALGHVEFAEHFNDHKPDLRASMIELQTCLKYEKQLRNLQIQEARLARRRQQDLAELRQLQKERRTAEAEAEKAALESVANGYTAARTGNGHCELSTNGFVFSTAQIEQHLASRASGTHPTQTLKPAA